MRDERDPGTADMALPPAAKPRGRPPVGQRAQTNAERQEAFRRRRLARLSLSSEDLPKASMATLLARLQDLATHAKGKPWQAFAVHQVLDEIRARYPLPAHRRTDAAVKNAT
jgi:hypothetical protein